jgi:hypothetical protein
MQMPISDRAFGQTWKVATDSITVEKPATSRGLPPAASI